MRTRLRAREPLVTPEGTGALVLVDQAIRSASQRKFLNRDEALTLLRGVVAGIDTAAIAATAASIVDDAASSYDDALLVACTRVVDLLLDLRLALTG